MRALFYLFIFVLITGAPPAFAVENYNAKQLDFRTGYRGHTFVYHYKWLSRSGQEQKMSFELKKQMAQSSNREFKRYSPEEEMQYVLAAMRDYKPIHPQIEVSVQRLEKSYRISYAGFFTDAEIAKEKQAVEQYLKGLEQVYFKNSLYRLDERWGRLPDYIQIAQAYAPRVRPVAEAIDNNTRGFTPREKINYALEFLQSIPYDKLLKRENSNGSGYATPVELLSRNIADCDSKSVALMSILKNLFPQTPMVMVIVPGHAFVGVATALQPGDANIHLAGQTYVLAEPVGPALHPLGQVSAQSLQGLQKKDFSYLSF